MVGEMSESGSMNLSVLWVFCKNLEEIWSIAVLHEWRGQLADMVGSYVPHPISDLFNAGYL